METTYTLGLSQRDQTTYTTIFQNEKGRISFDVAYPEDVFLHIYDNKGLQGIRSEGMIDAEAAADAQTFRRDFGTFLFSTFPVGYDTEASEAARQTVLNHFKSL